MMDLQLHVQPKSNMLHRFSQRTIKDHGDMLCKFHTKDISHKLLRWHDAFKRDAITWTVVAYHHHGGLACSSQRFSIRTPMNTQQQRQLQQHRQFKISKHINSTCRSELAYQQHQMVQRLIITVALQIQNYHIVMDTMKLDAFKYDFTTIGFWFPVHVNAGDQIILLVTFEENQQPVLICKPYKFTIYRVYCWFSQGFCRKTVWTHKKRHDEFCVRIVFFLLSSNFIL